MIMQPDQPSQPSSVPEQPAQAPLSPYSPAQPPQPAVPTQSEPIPPQPVVTTPAQVEPYSPPVAFDANQAVEAPPPVQVESAVTSPAADEPIHWQATEYIHHEKNTAWFIVFAVVVVAFMLVAILVIQSITFAVLVPVMAAALLVYTHRPPRILDYTLSTKGLYINDKLYPLSDYKTFGIIHDTGEYSVMLIPTKRFKPGVTVYFPEEAGEAIVDTLGARLPMQELQLDVIDRLIRQLRI